LRKENWSFDRCKVICLSKAMKNNAAVNSSCFVEQITPQLRGYLSKCQKMQQALFDWLINQY